MSCSFCNREGHRITTCADLFRGIEAQANQNISCVGHYIKRQDVEGLEIEQGPGILITAVCSLEFHFQVNLGDIVVPKRRVGPDEYFRLARLPEGARGVVFQFEDPAALRDFIHIRWMKDGRVLEYGSTANICDIEPVSWSTLIPVESS